MRGRAREVQENGVESDARRGMELEKNVVEDVRKG
jgi:hypothetical protein